VRDPILIVVPSHSAAAAHRARDLADALRAHGRRVAVIKPHALSMSDAVAIMTGAMAGESLAAAAALFGNAGASVIAVSPAAPTCSNRRRPSGGTASMTSVIADPSCLF